MADYNVKANNGRFDGISRPYSPAEVQKLRGSVVVEHTLARNGAEKLWKLLHTEKFVPALGALSGNQVGLTAWRGSHSRAGWWRGHAAAALRVSEACDGLSVFKICAF